MVVYHSNECCFRVVKQAEAHADAAALAGSGVARQRKEIVDGLRDAVKEFGQSIEGIPDHESGLC